MSSSPTDKTMTLRCTERKQAAMKYITTDIIVRGQTYTPQSIIAAYQAPLDARATLKAARLQTKTSLGLRKAADAAMEAQDEIVQSWVDTTFGPQSQQASDFGYIPKQPAKVTATEKVQAAAKAKVTRQALGTKGKKQKKTAKKQLSSTGGQGQPPNGSQGPSKS